MCEPRNAYIATSIAYGYVTDYTSSSNCRSNYCMSYPNGKTQNENQTGAQVAEMAESVSLLRWVNVRICRRQHSVDPYFSACAQNTERSVYYIGYRTLPLCTLFNRESD